MMKKQYQLSSKGHKVITLILGLIVLYTTYYIWNYIYCDSILEPVLDWLFDIELFNIGMGLNILFVASWIYVANYITKYVSTRLATWRFSLH